MKYPFQMKAVEFGTEIETLQAERLLSAMIKLGDIFYDKWCVSKKYKGKIDDNGIWDFKKACENLARCFADTNDVEAYLELNEYVKAMPDYVRPSKSDFYKGYWMI
jgi:hypothetical protein